jgi:hypothetical protein
MKQTFSTLFGLLAIFLIINFSSCSKSGGGGSGTGGTGNNPPPSIFPLALNNSWNYKLKDYNTNNGAVLDSSFFALTITGKLSANGITYYQFANSADTTTIETLASINASTLGSIDSAYGLNYYTFFLSGTGDSTQVISSWPVTVSINGARCEGTNKLYAHYADTTLINEDGTTYTLSMKNVIVTYDCSGNKLYANVYFIKQGVGLVRFSKYIYNSEGEHLLKLAWVLQSESLN